MAGRKGFLTCLSYCIFTVSASRAFLLNILEYPDPAGNVLYRMRSRCIDQDRYFPVMLSMNF